MPEATRLAGTYVLGVFQGTSEGDFPKLLVGTFPKEDGTLYQERLQFDPFDRRTGVSTLPEGLKVGDRVAVRLGLSAKEYSAKGDKPAGVFVARQALQVIPA